MAGLPVTSKYCSSVVIGAREEVAPEVGKVSSGGRSGEDAPGDAAAASAGTAADAATARLGGRDLLGMTTNSSRGIDSGGAV